MTEHPSDFIILSKQAIYIDSTIGKAWCVNKERVDKFLGPVHDEAVNKVWEES